MPLQIPKDYRSLLTLRQTEQAIKKVKDFFERDLAVELNLTRVSAVGCDYGCAAFGFSDPLSRCDP